MRVVLLFVIVALLGHCSAQYSFQSQPGTWYDGQKSCDVANSHLAILPSATPYNTLIDVLPTGTTAWVGGRYVRTAFEWTDGLQDTLYEFVGCYSDLPTGTTVGSSAATDVLSCFKACPTGTRFVGLSGNVCSCLPGLPAFDQLVGSTECSTTCEKNFEESCGGNGGRNSVYNSDTFPYNVDTSPLTDGYRDQCGYLYRDNLISFGISLRFDVCDTIGLTQSKPFVCQQCGDNPAVHSCTSASVTTYLPWTAALTNCRLVSSNLASSYGVNFTNYFNVPPSGQEFFWIGLQVKEKYQWVDGTDLPSNAWGLPAVPTNSDDCLTMTKDSSGVVSWNLRDCSTSLPSLCELYPHAPTQAPASSTPASNLPQPYFAINLPWDAANYYCSEYNSQLTKVQDGNFADVKDLFPNGTSAWVGGRILHHAWQWADLSRSELYTEIGCYDSQHVYGVLADIVPNKFSVLECFASCPTSQYIAMRNMTCLCLEQLPTVSDVIPSACSYVCMHDFRRRCGGDFAYTAYERVASFPYELDSSLSEHDEEPVCALLHKDPFLNAGLSVKFANCTNMEIPYICEDCTGVQLGNCPVYIQNNSVHYIQALLSCSQMGMDLATLKSGDLTPVIPDSSFTQEYWIGLMQDKLLIWNDGSELNKQDYTSGVSVIDGECVAVAKDNFGVTRLQQHDCNQARPFICG